jgi:hypothetical protein
VKYVFWCLLLLNGSYFGLQLLMPAEKPQLQGRTQSSSGANILFLSELSSAGIRNAEMSEVVSNPLRIKNDGAQTCVAVGPFVDVFSGQNALEQLSALDLRVELKAVDVAAGGNDYRLLIPSASSPEEAFRKLRELQASDIDSYVITQGPQALGISLGVFSTTVAAEALKDRVEAMGYSSEILEIVRLSRAYWIFLGAETDFTESANTWMANRPELEMKSLKCVES